MTFTFHPFVVTAISDHAEGNAIAMLDLLDCRYCTLSKAEYCEHDEIGIPRTVSKYPNPLSSTSFDPFNTAHCIFHDVDEGLWKWILQTIILPSFNVTNHQRLFKKDVENLTYVTGLQRWTTLTSDTTSFLTARHMRHLLVQLVVVLAAWTFRSEVKDDIFLLVLKLCDWYSIVRSYRTTESEIAHMESLTISLRQLLRSVVKTETGSDYESKALKHHVILHYGDLIRRFGAMLFQSCEMWDSAHKYMIKAHLVSHGSTNFQSTVATRVREKLYICTLFCFKSTFHSFQCTLCSRV